MVEEMEDLLHFTENDAGANSACNDSAILALRRRMNLLNAAALELLYHHAPWTGIHE